MEIVLKNINFEYFQHLQFDIKYKYVNNLYLT